MSWRGRDVVSMRDFSKGDLEVLFERARDMEKYARSGLDLLKGKILAVAFFEPSTRTRLSFEAAMRRLGGDVIGFSSAEGTSVEKGETFADTIRMLDAYADAIIVRHRLEGAVKFAAEVADAPVINAGDGSFNHPTQAMLDLYTIWRERGRIDGLRIGLMGDLKYARTVNSLLEGLALFDVEVELISPEFLRPRQEVLDYISSRLRYRFRNKLDEVLRELDVLYIVRIQKERFLDPLEYERVRGSYRLTADSLKGAKDELIVLHPLPRVDELDASVDGTKHAKYFRQAMYGVPLRMALLSLVLV